MARSSMALTQEQELCVERIKSIAPGAKQSPALAASQSDLLAVWLDRRAWTNRYTFIAPTDLYVSRLGAGGSLLDPSGRALVHQVRGNSSSVKVASDGLNYLVTWCEPPKLFALAVVDGSVASPPVGLGLDCSPFNERLTVFWAGSSYIVATTGSTFVPAAQGADVSLQRVSRAGALVDASPVLVSARDGGSNRSVSGHSGGGSALLAWDEGPGIFARLIELDGGAVQPATVTVSANGSGVTVSPLDGGYWIADIENQRVTGRVVSGAGVASSPITLLTTPSTNYRVRASSLGSNTIATAWDDGAATSAIGLDPTSLAVNISVVGLPSASGLSTDALLAVGGGFTSIGSTPGNNVVSRSRFDSTLGWLDTAGLTDSANAQRFVSLAATSQSVVAAWLDSRGGTYPSLCIELTFRGLHFRPRRPLALAVARRSPFRLSASVSSLTSDSRPRPPTWRLASGLRR